MNNTQKTVCISMVLAAIALFYFITSSEKMRATPKLRATPKQIRRRARARRLKKDSAIAMTEVPLKPKRRLLRPRRSSKANKDSRTIRK